MLTFAILLIVSGAILRFAVNVEVPGISLQKVGVILMVAGALTLMLALIFGYADPGNHQGLAERSSGAVSTHDAPLAIAVISPAVVVEQAPRLLA